MVCAGPLQNEAEHERQTNLSHYIDLFNTNASIVRDLAKAAAEAAPEANILVISNPVRCSQITTKILEPCTN